MITALLTPIVSLLVSDCSYVLFCLSVWWKSFKAKRIYSVLQYRLYLCASPTSHFLIQFCLRQIEIFSFYIFADWIWSWSKVELSWGKSSSNSRGMIALPLNFFWTRPAALQRKLSPYRVNSRPLRMKWKIPPSLGIPGNKPKWKWFWVYKEINALQSSRLAGVIRRNVCLDSRIIIPRMPICEGFSAELMWIKQPW